MNTVKNHVLIAHMANNFQIRSQRQNEQPVKECHSFSLVYANGERSLELVIFVIYT